MVDLAVSGAGHDARMRVAPGGSAANVAVWAASQGTQATVVGRVGDDFAGRALSAELERRGVRVAVGVDAEAPTGTFAVVDGELRADQGASARLAPAHLPEHVRADVVLVSGYLARETVVAALARAESPWRALLPGRLEELPDGADAVVVNEPEARRLSGFDPDGAARRLAERFRLACVTRGPDGAVAVLEGRLERAPPAAAVGGEALGAGDAFAAGLLVALARGAGLAEALAAGSRCGALAAASPDGWPE
jgi:sugar/nucleoside kinase (ribokinase family)